MARLEYRLTKAYLRYRGGQRFGFVNPSFCPQSSGQHLIPIHMIVHQAPVRYRGLFDVKMAHASDAFFQQALAEVVDIGGEETEKSRLAAFLKDVQPKSPFYYTLQEKLKSEVLTEIEKMKILVNMERCRWREADSPARHKKYVLVNIPSFHLYAIDEQDTLSMRLDVALLRPRLRY